jgi:hypothetical protein
MAAFATINWLAVPAAGIMHIVGSLASQFGVAYHRYYRTTLF